MIGSVVVLYNPTEDEIKNINSYIHWYTASWQSSYSKAKTKLQQLLGPSLTSEIIDLKKKFKSFIHGK